MANTLSILLPRSPLPNTQMLAVRSICTVAALLALCSCTRTSDGTVVPKYQMTVSRHGWSPRIAIHKTAVAPAPSQSFEPPPLPEVEAVRTRSPSKATRRRSSPSSHSEKSDTSGPARPEILHCRQVPTKDGRHRVDCS